MSDIDVAGLVRDGHLGLEDIFLSSEWEEEEDWIAEYTAELSGGESYDVVRVALQRAEEYGVTAWRWAEVCDHDGGEAGEPMLDRAAAVAAGEAHAKASDRPPAPRAVVSKILASPFWRSCPDWPPATRRDITIIIAELRCRKSGVVSAYPWGEVRWFPATRPEMGAGDIPIPPGGFASDALAAAALLAAVTGGHDDE